MRFATGFLFLILLSANLFAKGVDGQFTVNTTTYEDGVLILSDNHETGFQVKFSGPGNFSVIQISSQGDSVFLDINNTDGQTLADGLYQYKVMPTPARTFTLAESSNMPDRNDIKPKSVAVVHPVYGSFRVINGEVVDADLQEYDASANGDKAE